MCRNTQSKTEKKERDLVAAWNRKRRGNLVGKQAHPSNVSDRDSVCGVVEGRCIYLWTCIMRFAGAAGQHNAGGLCPDLKNHFHKSSADLHRW